MLRSLGRSSQSGNRTGRTARLLCLIRHCTGEQLPQCVPQRLGGGLAEDFLGETAGQASIRALLDESAVLACLAYVDLNPERAAIAETPEASDYASILRRIRTLQAASAFCTDGENAEPDIAPAPTEPLDLYPFVGDIRDGGSEGLPFHLACRRLFVRSTVSRNRTSPRPARVAVCKVDEGPFRQAFPVERTSLMVCRARAQRSGRAPRNSSGFYTAPERSRSRAIVLAVLVAWCHRVHRLAALGMIVGTTCRPCFR